MSQAKPSQAKPSQAKLSTLPEELFRIMAELAGPAGDLSALARDLSMRASDLLARVGDLDIRGDEECTRVGAWVARAEDFLDRARLLCEIIRLTRELEEAHAYAANERRARASSGPAEVGGNRQRRPSSRPLREKPERSPTGARDRPDDRDCPDRAAAGEADDRTSDL